MNLDMTFCASPNCTNKCGRKWTEAHTHAAKRCGMVRHISMAYFCGAPEGDEPKDDNQMEGGEGK